MRTFPPTSLVKPRGAFSRRTLLKGAAATAGVTAGGSRSATAAPSAQSDDHVDVVVVGAGLAGLTAALALAKACRSVVVLEAQDHVGGRMVRQEVGSGAYVDLGGQWVGPISGAWAQDRIVALGVELGLERFEWYHTGATRFVYRDIDGTFLPFDGEPPPVSEDEVKDAKAAWQGIEDLATTVNPETPWMPPEVAEPLDQETLASWLDRTTHTDFARFAITNMARIGGSGAFEPEQVSMLHMAFTQAASPQREGPEAELFVGAAGQIPPLLAQELADRTVPVVLNAPVLRIEQDDTGVILHTPGEIYQARYAIVAIPPILTGDIAYDPPLPTQRLQLVQEMPMGSLLKFHAVYPSAFWREAGLSGIAITDLPTTPFTADSSPPSGTPGILTTFIAGKPAEDRAGWSPEERRVEVLKDFVTCFGPGAANPSQFVEANWPAEEWIGGAFTAYLRPGAWTRYGAALRTPVGRIHWAGTETATRWTGYFDGAIRSGEAAAATVLAQLGESQTEEPVCLPAEVLFRTEAALPGVAAWIVPSWWEVGEPAWWAEWEVSAFRAEVHLDLATNEVTGGALSIDVINQAAQARGRGEDHRVTFEGTYEALPSQIREWADIGFEGTRSVYNAAEDSPQPWLVDPEYPLTFMVAMDDGGLLVMCSQAAHTAVDDPQTARQNCVADSIAVLQPQTSPESP